MITDAQVEAAAEAIALQLGYNPRERRRLCTIKDMYKPHARAALAAASTFAKATADKQATGVEPTSDMVEAATLSLAAEGRFPTNTLSLSGGIDFWRSTMRKALIRALSLPCYAPIGASQDKPASAEAESETCSKCDAIFEPHHHFVRCNATDCPMKSKTDTRSALEMFRDGAPLSASAPAGAPIGWRCRVEEEALGIIENWCGDDGPVATLGQMERLAEQIAEGISAPAGAQPSEEDVA